MKSLIGPFSQILTLDQLSLKGLIKDEDLDIRKNVGIIEEGGVIMDVVPFSKSGSYDRIEEIESECVLLPGLVDSHTHMCWGGNRAADYSLRISGATYQDILKRGGGIHESVRKTREASKEELTKGLKARMDRHLNEGVTTVEIKSGYGLSVNDEIKMLEVIQGQAQQRSTDIISTCLGAHVRPAEFETNQDYLEYLVRELLPEVKRKGLAKRVDIFVEDGAFGLNESKWYLEEAKKLGFELTVHADQFSPGGTQLAVDLNALSADHLENSDDKEIKCLAQSNTVGTVLPGASLGLGMKYAPVRKLLDAGVCVAIASDWNPGSAPMGDLLIQAALLGASEKLSTAETFAGLTFRAAQALGLSDRGMIKAGKVADFIAFETDDYREILWHQGKMKPSSVWKNGKRVK